VRSSPQNHAAVFAQLFPLRASRLLRYDLPFRRMEGLIKPPSETETGQFGNLGDSRLLKETL
jgi:hypothetical protein